MGRYDGGWQRFDAASGYGEQYRGGGGARRGYDMGYADVESWAETTYSPATYGPSRYGLGPYHERLRKRRRPDAELREEVDEALFYDTWVDAEAITVEVKDGVVTLRGELPSYEEIRYATDDAWDVDGVVGVRSELTVRDE